ncbi:MAG: LamG-like jellyroll fold domain-containing protein, partial [Mariniphaga sp.]|nr:LamG-like jellyroll fold domain-containing protein [Mariniphaga sp.]
PDGAGESYRSEEVNINTNVTENNIRIGSVKYADYYFNGSLDDIRIYNKSLTAKEISDIYDLKTANSTLDNKKKVRLIPGNSMIKIALQSNESALLHLYDIKGSLIQIQKIDPGINQIDVQPGIYIAHVKTGGNIESGKVISF